MFGVNGGSKDNGVPRAKLARKPNLDIKDEDGTSDPEKLIGTIETPTTHGGGASQKYKAVVKDPSGTFQWTCTGNATIAGSSTDGVVEVQGSAVSTAVDDTVLTVTYTLNGASQTKSVKITIISVEIEVNTNAANDSIVQLKCDHPAHRHNVPCTVRLMGPTAARIILGSPDGRLRFPGDTDNVMDCELTGNQDSKNFDISGDRVSDTLGDAIIEARVGSVNGPVLATKGVTVFSFDASLILAAGNEYGFVPDPDNPTGPRQLYTVTDGVACQFSAEAAIVPSGLDCSAQQIENLRVTFMQQVELGGDNLQIWGNPQAKWEAWVEALVAAKPDTTVTGTAPSQIIRKQGFDLSSVTLPIRDGEGGTPLYSIRDEARQPPSNCGGGIAIATDTPRHSVLLEALNGEMTSPELGGKTVGTVRYTFLKTTRTERFRTFCVIWVMGTEEVCSYREALWEINLDSSQPGQRAVVQKDGPATVDPQTGVCANAAKQQVTSDTAGISIFQL